jgi:hypothetical protein
VKSRGRLLLAAVWLAGLVLYLWPALSAPPVLWSDSVVDLARAESGVGVWKPLAREDLDLVHPAKPGYLLFLRAAGAAVPFTSRERSIVLVQSVLLWLSIVGVSALVARRSSSGAGAAVAAALFLFVPLRDSASAVMSEAIAAALFLPLVFLAVEPPASAKAGAAAAIVTVVLFWIRPNVAGIAALAIAGSWLAARRVRPAVAFAVVGIAVAGAIWAATAAPAGPDRSRGFADAILAGSAEYAWAPMEGEVVGRGASQDNRLALARGNWRAALDGHPADRRRELVWRALHGFLGLEFYDARWSAAYRAIDHAARLLVPWLVAAGLAGALAGSRSRRFAIAGALLLAGLVAQSLVLGAIPRYAVPVVPGVLVVGAAALFRPRIERTPGRAFAAWLLVAGLLALHPEILSWEWGQLEREGATLAQRIPRGALPRRAPATLHLRIGQPVASEARYVLSMDGRDLVSGPDPRSWRRAVVAIPLDQPTLDASGSRDVTLAIRSVGAYGPHAYELFAVVPPPLGRGARREPDGPLSPGSDIASGGLDWWAHEGADR